MSKITIDQLARMMQDEFSNSRKELFGFKEEVADEFSSFRKEVSGEFSSFRKEVSGEFSSFRKEVSGEFSSFRKEVSGEFSKINSKVDNLVDIVEWIATEIKTIKQELVFNQAAHDRYEGRIIVLEKEVSLLRAQLKK